MSAFYHIRALRHIRNSLTDDTAKVVAVALVQSRLDYDNYILYSISKSTLLFQTSFVSYTGCPSKIASNSNLQPSPTMHSLLTNHHINLLFFIHMSPVPLLPYAPPANILPFPDAKLSLANALSVTVLLGSGATSLSKFDLPLQSLSSNVI
jgi:hypothetical protein